ncbi:MAG TPA: nucleotide disphospho-sugar-binding domain-containing protein [Streptosporangiaceae bacterium]|nr:nucleotide disphospho-sugar-binding domain-containing protein [Streptosporangiaceae bacterium]
MKVLFTPWAMSPHYFPLVPIGWALRNAGHEVRVACSPRLVDVVTDSGLPAVAVGEDVDLTPLVCDHMGVDPDAELNAERWADLRRMKGPRALEMFVAFAELMAEDLIEFGRTWQPDLIVHTPSAFVGPLAAAALGVPNVRHLKGPDIAAGIAPIATRLMRPLCDKFNVASIEPLGVTTVDTCPASLRVDASYPRLDMRYVPYNGPGIVPDWLLDPPSRPRVCVTWGGTLGRLNPRLMLAPMIMEAIKDMDIEVVVTAQPADHGQFGGLPENVRLLDAMPLNVLLPSCSALIDQGGVGTAMTGAALGVPQLVVPQFPDHMFTAGHLVTAGCGLVRLPEEATPEVIRADLERLLEEDALRESAGRVAAEMAAMPIPAEVVGQLESVAAAAGLPVAR